MYGVDGRGIIMGQRVRRIEPDLRYGVQQVTSAKDIERETESGDSVSTNRNLIKDERT
jgi:hypothetical protein